MKSKIKTTNEEWKYRALVIALLLLVLIIILVGAVFRYEYELKELEKQIQETKENSIQVGQNSTVNYIIANKKYPIRYKKNIIWLTKNDLCENK